MYGKLLRKLWRKNSSTKKMDRNLPQPLGRQAFLRNSEQQLVFIVKQYAAHDNGVHDGNDEDDFVASERANRQIKQKRSQVHSKAREFLFLLIAIRKMKEFYPTKRNQRDPPALLWPVLQCKTLAEILPFFFSLFHLLPHHIFKCNTRCFVPFSQENPQRPAVALFALGRARGLMQQRKCNKKPTTPPCDQRSFAQFCQPNALANDGKIGQSMG